MHTTASKNEVKLSAPGIAISHDRKNIAMKSILVVANRQMLIVAIRRRLSMKSYTMRVQITAVKTDVTKPMQRVTAKPLTGPDPN